MEIKEVLIRCTSCKLLFEGMDLKLCPKCQRPYLEVAASYPYIKPEEVDEEEEPRLYYR